MATDPYKELGVNRSASDAEIQKAFRKLAKELHPDRNQGNKVTEERFKKVTAAYDFLSDSARRKRFDRGEIDADGRETFAGFGGGAGRGGFQGGPQGGFQGRFDGVDLGDIFGDVFGAGAGRGGPFGGGAVKGQDMRIRLDIDLIDSIHGALKRVLLSDGRTVDVTIPKGSKDGQTLRLKGQGGAAPGGRGPAGDVLIEIAIRPHPIFRADGADLHMDLFVSLPDAILGGKAQAATPDGPVSVNLPKNANSGAVLRLKGRGGLNKDKTRGDLFAHIVMALPEKGLDSLPEPLRQEFESLLLRWRDTANYTPTVSLKKK